MWNNMWNHKSGNYLDISYKQLTHTYLSTILAIDLLEKMLEVDADRRITAEQALAHQYLAQYADPTDEPTSAPYDQTFEDLDLPVDQWKGDSDMIYLNFNEFFAIAEN